ncbi:outer membrane beta-barrel protein [Myroides sp. LJL115]
MYRVTSNLQGQQPQVASRVKAISKSIFMGLLLLSFSTSFAANDLRKNPLENKTFSEKYKLFEKDRDLEFIAAPYGSSFFSDGKVELYLLAGINFAGAKAEGFSTKAGSNFGLGASYNLPLNYKWSLIAGLEISMSQNTFKNEGLTGQGNYVDPEGEFFIFKYRTSSFEETFKTTRLSIPILVEYELLDQRKLYARTGFKFGINLNSKIDLQANNLQTSGYFPEYDVEFKEPSFAGFGDFGDFKHSVNTDVKARVSYLLEVGTSFELPSYDLIQVSVFYDLGITNEGFSRSNESDLVEYRPVFNDAITLNSGYQVSGKKLKTSSVGIKVSYSFDF